MSVSAPAVTADIGASLRSVGLNTIYQIGSQIAPAIAALLGIPFLVRHLGPEAFGIVTIFSVALVYFTMLDLGLGRATSRFVAQSLETGRLDDVRRYFWGSIILLAGIGLIVTVSCMLAVPTVVSSWLKISPNYSHAACVAFYAIALTIPLATLMSTFRGFLEAWGRFPLISVVSAGGGVGLYLFPVLAVVLGGGLVGVAAAMVLVRVTMCLAFAAGCFWTIERPSLHPIFDGYAVKRMLSFGGWLTVSSIVGTAMLYGDRLLLGIGVSLAAVASYGMPLDVISKVQILISSLCAVLFPLMSRLDESRSPRFHSVYQKALAVTFSLMTPLTLSAVLAAPWLMRLWLGPRNTADAVFAAQVFLAGAIVQSIASIAWTALHARGRSDLTAWVHLVEFPLYCAAFYWAATRFGVRGAALAWLGRAIVDFLCMVVLLGRLGHRPGFALPRELAAGLISVSILFVLSLPMKEAVTCAVALCILTWMWVWRTLLDSSARAKVTRAVFGQRNPYAGHVPAIVKELGESLFND